MSIPKAVTRISRAFIALLDSESVKLFVWPYYLALFAWGVYGTFWSAPLSIVDPAMGHQIYNAWVWLHIAGTSAVMLGLIMPGAFKYLGLWMQLGGNLCMALVLFAFEWAAISGSYWGRGTYSVFVIAPYVLGCMFLALTVCRKLYLAERLSKVIAIDGADAVRERLTQ